MNTHLLLASALRTLIMGVTLFAALRALRIHQVRAQRTAWLLALVSALAMPAFVSGSIGLRVLPSFRLTSFRLPSLRLPAFTPPSFPRTTLAPASSVTDPVTYRPHHTQLAFIPAAHEQIATSVVPAQPHQERRHWPISYAATLYCLIAGFLQARLVTGLTLALRLRNQAARAGTSFDGAFDTALDNSNIRISNRIATPVTIADSILLPVSSAQWSMAKLRVVLSHERAHIRQHDFYIQLLASLNCAIFWFNPFSWWLQKHLSALGEAMSDLAALEQAESRTSYAEVLLEFATSAQWPLTGVAMARSGSLRIRIERLLSERLFEQSYTGRRRLPIVAAAVGLLAVCASTSLVRVHAAQKSAQESAQNSAQTAANNSPALATQAAEPAAPVAAADAPQAASSSTGTSTSQGSGTSYSEGTSMGAGPSSAATGNTSGTTEPSAEPQDNSQVAPPTVPATEPSTPPTPPQPETAGSTSAGHYDSDSDSDIHNDSQEGTHDGSHAHSHASTYIYNHNGDGYALVSGTGSFTFSGDWNQMGNFEAIRKGTHGDFLYYRHDGKSYVIDDPTIVARAKALYAPIEALGKLQEVLGKQQEVLGKQQEALGRRQSTVKITNPDLSKEMAAMTQTMQQMKQLQSEKEVDRESLASLQEKLGEIQGKLGALQGEAGEQQGKLGEQQGVLGEQQGKLGEEQGRLGERQGKLSEEAHRQIVPMIQQAIQDGKARPVN